MFISKEVEALYCQYQDNPFGNKKDRRIESWLKILGRLPTILNTVVELINEIYIDFDIEDNEEIESLLMQLIPWRKGPFRINDILIDLRKLTYSSLIKDSGATYSILVFPFITSFITLLISVFDKEELST